MLVERESLLAELVADVDDALAGHGRVVLLGGEAGVGKTSLVRAVADTVRPRCTVRMGGVDNVTTADALAAFQDAVPEIAGLLASGADRMRLFRELRGAILSAPGLVILEDLHWADGATLDAVRYLARRIEGVPVVLLGTYRHDEVSARHPLTVLLGDLATTGGVQRRVVPPLTVDGVGTLIAHSGLSVDPSELHRRTGGNAFFVTESLAIGGEELPATVSDAILARRSRLTPAAQDVSAAAAVLGTAADAELLVAVSGRGLDAVDECLDAGVLVSTGDGILFRHELARLAVSSSLSAARRRRVHGRALRALAQRTPDDHRALAHHAAGWGDGVAVMTHAVRAAERASRGSAHREAAEQYRLALRHGTATAAERTDLFVRLSYECYLTDQLPEALIARQRALELHELAGDVRGRGDDERWLSRLSWFLGNGADAERHALRAIGTLEALAPGAELAMAYSNLAQLRMLADDTDEVERWGRRALHLATAIGDVDIEAHALNNLGTAAIEAGRVAEGVRDLTHSLDLALSADLPEHVARAYTNLGAAAVAQHRFRDALTSLDAGIAYCEERDLDSWARYMTACRCVVLADQGRFAEALAAATALLEHPDTAAVSLIPAAASAARVLSRRGEDASSPIALATRLADRTGEIQRIGPAACAAAEQAWILGRTDSIRALTDGAWALALAHEDPWSLGELAWWRTLGDVAASDQAVLAEPFALMLAGSPDAVARWTELGSPIWAAYAGVLDPDPASVEHAVQVLEGLGAIGAVQAVRRTRQARGLPLPRRPHARTRANPGRLTDRELEVLELLGDGLSTAEIAKRLVVSPRTAEHHIAAVLHKLAEPTRARAVAAARRGGLLP